MIMRRRHELSPRAMKARIARFVELPDYRNRVRSLGVPDEAITLFGPKEIHQVMGPAVLGLSTFAIEERSLSIAGSPPGNGSALHVHDCVETFFI